LSENENIKDKLGIIQTKPTALQSTYFTSPTPNDKRGNTPLLPNSSKTIESLPLPSQSPRRGRAFSNRKNPFLDSFNASLPSSQLKRYKQEKEKKNKINNFDSFKSGILNFSTSRDMISGSTGRSCSARSCSARSSGRRIKESRLKLSNQRYQQEAPINILLEMGAADFGVIPKGVEQHYKVPKIPTTPRLWFNECFDYICLMCVCEIIKLFNFFFFFALKVTIS
jgi:hypothetical protein